jgi:hypothetical protein
MRKQFLLSFLFLFIFISFLEAQTVEEMTAEKAQKEKELAELKPQAEDLAGKVATLEADVAALADKLTPYPRWDLGAFGTLGLNVANFNDWLSKEKPSTVATNIGVTANLFANLDQKKYFWRNSLGLNLGWLKFEDKTEIERAEFEVASDALNYTSLFGYKLNDKIAVSALAEYRTAILREKLNDPGFLDIGVGVTLTPITDLVIVIHPLNYNFVFSKGDLEYESSLGAKIVVDYKKEIIPNLAWRSNLSAFFSYEDTRNFSNWTWVNGFSTTVKGIGVGLEVGFRNNRQEGYNAYKVSENASPDLTVDDFDSSPSTADNPLQTYWVLGFSYAISSK